MHRTCLEHVAVLECTGLRIVFSENLYTLPLPTGHRFPIQKYRQIYDSLANDVGSFLQVAPPAEFDEIRLIHTDEYVQSCVEGSVSWQAQRRLGFPWSPTLVDRGRRSVGGTLSALLWALSHGAAGHIAGGTHHAFADRGEGFCLFNDIAVAIAVARRDHGIKRVAVIDLDVHQGNGTAHIFAADRDVFTLSLHGAKNYPFHKERSSLDVELADAIGDNEYIAKLDEALPAIRAFSPELLFYQAGVDSLQGDRLGRLHLTHQGLQTRDRRVFELAKQLHVPLVVTLGGGYHPELSRSVTAHTNVYRELTRWFR